MNTILFKRPFCLNLICLSSILLGVYGCSAITIPSPGDVMKTPLGTESIKIGMSRQQVESLWGKPDEIKMVEDAKRWSDQREMWVYRAHYGSIPINAGYLSETKRLYFDGNNLTDMD